MADQFTYNGVDLNVASSRVGVSTEFVKDDAGRTVIYNRHVITATFVVQDDAGTDPELLNLRAKLSKQGAPLVFFDKGFHGIVCNTPGGAVDIKAGPAPEVLEWVNLAAGNAAEVTWRCVVCLPPICDSTTVPIKGVVAINYEASHRISAKGFSTRTFTGYIEVVVARIGPRNLSDCADLYRDFMTAIVPLGFDREQEWTVDASKSRLDFTITDRQIESKNAYPPGVTRISAGHDVDWNATKRALLYNTLNMDIELKPGVHQVVGYQYFLQMLQARVAAATKSGGERFPWLEALHLSEDIYGFSSSFSARWRVIGCLDDIISPTGIWTPVNPGDTGSAWVQWRSSMADAFSNRGYAGLAVDAGNDYIVDLCTGSSMPMPNSNITFPNPPKLTLKQISNSKPPEKYSWLEYTMSVSPSRSLPVVRQATLQTPTPLDSQGSMDSTKGIGYEAGQAVADILQVGGAPRYSFTLWGWAKRAAYEIARPVLSSVGGQAVQEVASSIETDYTMAFGQPVWWAAWAAKYVIAKSPGTVSPAQNKVDDPCAKAAGIVLK